MPEFTHPPSPKMVARFWSKVDQSGDCWIWLACCEPRFGYGKFATQSHSPKLAHRVSYEITFGPIPNGLLVLHKCDNPKCVRPDHFFLGTKLDNNKDMAAKGRNPGHVNPPNKKLSDEQVVQLREMAAAGVRNRDLSELFGLSRPAVSSIVSRRERANCGG